MRTILILALASSRAWAASQEPSAEELGVVFAADPERAGAPRPIAKDARSAVEPAKTASDAQPRGACPPDDAVFLPTGFTFNALLPDAVFSFALTAPVMALLEDDVRFQGRIVLPRGTRLVGNASAIHALDRVNILWELAVLPEGCEFNFPGIALSAEDGSAGIKGKLERHESSIAGHIAMRSMLSAANAAATVVSPVQGALASGFTNEANQTLSESLNKVKNLESIYIHERTPIRVFVLRRFVRTGA